MDTNTALTERFKSCFKILHESDLSQLRDLYSEQDYDKPAGGGTHRYDEYIGDRSRMVV